MKPQPYWLTMLISSLMFGALMLAYHLWRGEMTGRAVTDTLVVTVAWGTVMFFMLRSSVNRNRK